MSEAGEALGFEGTYPLDERFWFPAEQSAVVPWRYGDLVAVPASAENARDGKGRPWLALMVGHPACDLGAKGAPKGVQLFRVHPLKAVSRPQRSEIIAGYTVDPAGQLRVARLNCVYLAPVPGSATHAQSMFADLREPVRVPLMELTEAGRIAAMTHEARVAVLRRDALFRYRWNLSLDDVFALEQSRIAGDDAFEGPRPQWATSRGLTANAGRPAP